MLLLPATAHKASLENYGKMEVGRRLEIVKAGAGKKREREPLVYIYISSCPAGAPMHRSPGCWMLDAALLCALPLGFQLSSDRGLINCSKLQGISLSLFWHSLWDSVTELARLIAHTPPGTTSAKRGMNPTATTQIHRSREKWERRCWGRPKNASKTEIHLNY